MQNHSNESKGAVVPYIAVLLGLLLSAGILGWFISSRHTESPVSPIEQNAPHTTSLEKTNEIAKTPDTATAVSALPDIAAVYETETFDHLKSTDVAVLEEPSSEETVPTASLVRELHPARPASGEIIYAYSDNQPAYNETMRDWRVHNAVDIAVVPGEIATAAADGTVESIYEDRLLGQVIILSHFGGYQTVYANLSENPLVKEGDSVKLGDPLCEIGGSAVMELFLPEHLHFALLKNGTPINPADYWEE